MDCGVKVKCVDCGVKVKCVDCGVKIKCVDCGVKVKCMDCGVKVKCVDCGWQSNGALKVKMYGLWCEGQMLYIYHCDMKVKSTVDIEILFILILLDVVSNTILSINQGQLYVYWCEGQTYRLLCEGQIVYVLWP